MPNLGDFFYFWKFNPFCGPNVKMSIIDYQRVERVWCGQKVAQISVQSPYHTHLSFWLLKFIALAAFLFSKHGWIQGEGDGASVYLFFVWINHWVGLLFKSNFLLPTYMQEMPCVKMRLQLQCRGTHPAFTKVSDFQEKSLLCWHKREKISPMFSTEKTQLT